MAGQTALFAHRLSDQADPSLHGARLPTAHVPQDSSGSCKASYDLASEHRFQNILWVTVDQPKHRAGGDESGVKTEGVSSHGGVALGQWLSDLMKTERPHG